ncbi:hypothetical protein FRC17_005050 [Serendipita sp. 399]|nr:hypothetical protein FRC17_005050 [Serendipita sp. 399]
MYGGRSLGTGSSVNASRSKSLTLLSQPAVISNVLNKIPGTDNHLEELSIQYVSGQRVFFDPKQFRRILSRILSFQISFGTPHPTAEFCSALLSSFRNLQSLKWVSTSLKFEVVRELRDAVEWQFTLRYLWTQDTLLSTFPSPVLYNLTTLRVDGTRLKFEAETLVLPNLMELCLFGAWIYILQIQAPKLAYLCLRKGAVMPSNVLIPQLVNTQLRPSRLEVDEIVSGSLTEALITGPFKYITELHVWIGAYSARYTYLIPLMRRKPQGGPMFCPRLRHLVVSLYPSGVIKDIPRFRSALVNVLRRGSEVTEMPTVRCMEHDL